MQTISTRFDQELQKMIAEEANRLLEILASGASIRDINEYRHITGQLAAYRKIADFSEEIRSLLMKA